MYIYVLQMKPARRVQSMQILLAAATDNEINPTRLWLTGHPFGPGGHTVEVIITGVGGTVTAASLAARLATGMPQLVIQAGIGGSFTEALPPGSLAVVGDEVFADLGAIEHGRLTDVFDLGLVGSGQAPFTARRLVNPRAESWARTGLPIVRGATVNCIASTPGQVAAIRAKYNPDLESMEGAALHYVCLQQAVPFVQLRAISNWVGDRDRSRWTIAGSIASLNETLRRWLETPDFLLKLNA